MFEKQETSLCELELTYNEGNIHPLSLIGIKRIASNPGSVDVMVAYGAVLHVPDHALTDPWVK